MRDRVHAHDVRRVLIATTLVSLASLLACQTDPPASWQKRTPAAASTTVASVAPSESAPAPPAPIAPAPTPSATRPSIDAEQAHADNLAAATKAHANASCTVDKKLELIPRRATGLHYACKRLEKDASGAAADIALEGYALVAGRNVVEVEDSKVELRWPGKGALWDLRGDGGQSAVITRAECQDRAHRTMCTTRYLTYELRDDEWVVPEKLLRQPGTGHDWNGDGRLDFEFPLATLDLGGKKPWATTVDNWSMRVRVDVLGLQTWDGTDYADDLASLRPIYSARLDMVRARVRNWTEHSLLHPPADFEPEIGKLLTKCDLEKLRAAAEIYVFRRVLGDADAAAWAESEPVGNGAETSGCAQQLQLMEESAPSAATLLSALRGRVYPQPKRSVGK